MSTQAQPGNQAGCPIVSVCEGERKTTDRFPL